MRLYASYPIDLHTAMGPQKKKEKVTTYFVFNGENGTALCDIQRQKKCTVGERIKLE